MRFWKNKAFAIILVLCMAFENVPPVLVGASERNPQVAGDLQVSSDLSAYGANETYEANEASGTYDENGAIETFVGSGAIEANEEIDADINDGKEQAEDVPDAQADVAEKEEGLVGRSDGTGPFAIDRWWAAAKEEAAKADHVIGYDPDIGDIFGYDALPYRIVNYYKVIMPGETIAILPEVDLNNNGVQGGISWFSFTVWQFEECMVNTEFLVRSTPERTTLTPLEERTLPIPYGDRAVEKPDDPTLPAAGALTEFTYTSLYRNDTGLPIVLNGARGGYFEAFEDYGNIEGLREGIWTNFQGSGRKYYKTTLIFAEPYYDIIIDKAATFGVYYYMRDDLDFSNLIWPDPMSNYDLRYYVDGKDHTYVLPIPKAESYRFEFYENYEGGDFRPDESGSIEGDVFTYTFNFETRSHEFGQPNIGDYLRNQYLRPVLRPWPTLTFDAHGGTIDGEATKFIEFPDWGARLYKSTFEGYEFLYNEGLTTKCVQINDPVREGYIFLGWCRNPDDPEGTLIVELWPGSGDTRHQVVYAAWKEKTDISNAAIAGVSLSYGYSGKAYTPALTVTVDGVTLTKDVDYTVEYADNTNPGTATITITGIGNFKGVRLKKFEIVDCVSKIVNGKTYQLIPKNNSGTAVCSYSGKMVNNTKVYITDRSSSEAMKFKAVKNSDGTWKFINAKCELALAVQQNSSAVGKGLVLYNQTAKTAQNWKLSKKSDNSFAIINAVSGLSVAMSDASAVKGTTLSMAEMASSGLQRFYIVETDLVSSPYSGEYAVKAAKNKAFGLNIASSSKSDGANVNLYTYSKTAARRFSLRYSGGGYYRIENVNSGMVLTVKGNTKTDGANVIQSAWTAASGQRWKVAKNADGTVTLTNALGTVLHLSGNKTADGTNVVAKAKASTTAQKWYLG
ncbi:MAG: RICIN domain-containing protein [Lachnospiraceae bacterium]|nr:RICIN domain-containing protein [Lachnospiraceae bacterium]